MRTILLTGSDVGQLFGYTQPRLRTPELELPSRGIEVVEFANELGLELMPWQELAIMEGCRYDPASGKFAARRTGIMVARQQGKSHLMRMRLLAGMFLWGETWVSMAQNRGLALEQFERAVELVEATDWLRRKVKRVSKTNGKEALELKSGERWVVVAATKEGPRGFTGNLWVDELCVVSPEAIRAATPITTSVWNAQEWYTSNAGDDKAVVLNQMRARALAGDAKGTCWLEWSADPELAATKTGVMNPELWLQANPAIGYKTDIETIEVAARSEPEEHFRTERLCLPVSNVLTAWPFGAWDSCQVESMPISREAPTWFAIDVSPRRTRADLVAAQFLPDGKLGIAVVESWEAEETLNIDKVASDIADHYRHYSQPVGVYFESWGAAAVAARLRRAQLNGGGNVKTVQIPPREYAQACDEMLSAMSAGKIAHVGQATLTEAINACVRAPVSDGGWKVVRRLAHVPISAAVAAILVVHASSEPLPTVDFIAV